VLLPADYALLGNVIDVCTGDDLVCGLECLRKEKCRSYNCFAAENLNAEICYLNDETRFSRPEDFKESPGSTYFDLMQVGMITIFLKIYKIVLPKLTFSLYSHFVYLLSKAHLHVDSSVSCHIPFNSALKRVRNDLAVIRLVAEHQDRLLNPGRSPLYGLCRYVRPQRVSIFAL